MNSPPLLLLAAPGSPQALALLRALAPHWQTTTLLPGVARAATLREAATAAGLVLHLAAEGAPVLEGLPGLVEVYAPAASALCEPWAEPEAWTAAWRAEGALARRARLVVVPDTFAALVMRLVHGVPPARMRMVPPAALAAVLPALLALAPDLPPPDDASPAGFTLALNDYPVAGRPSGGAVRVREGLAALEREVVLLTLGAVSGCVPLSPGILQLTLPKTAAQRALEADLQALGGDALEDIAAALHAATHPALAALAADLAARAGLAVFEHCFLAPLLPVLRRAAPALPVVYDAHNHEAALKRELLRGHPAADLLADFTEAVEQALLAEAALVLACSEGDAEAFRPRARAVAMMPHGVTAAPPGPPAPQAGAAPRLGFLGSAHPPNLLAARFILEELAPALPDACFEIAGGVCGGLHTAAPNVVLHGVLPADTLSAVMAGWTLALNPVQGGGGASLKLSDYLAHGLPSLSTPHAARGFPVLAEGAGQVVPLAEFPAALRLLLRSPQRLRLMARAARDAAAALGWPQAAAAARQAIARLAPPPTAPAPPPAAAGAAEALAAALDEAPSIRLAAAQHAALGVDRPFVVLLGEAEIAPPPGTVLLRHDGSHAMRGDQRLRVPLPTLLLPPDPACTALWLGRGASISPSLLALADSLFISVKNISSDGETSSTQV